MPASDYTSTISGGLKLKGGAKDAGVKKKSKGSKDKASKPSTTQDDSTEAQAQVGDSKTDLALTTTPSSRDATPSDLLQPSSSGTGTGGSGKTEAQRRHEEIKRKRVCQTSQENHTHAPCDWQ
jgi:protein FAM32A